MLHISGLAKAVARIDLNTMEGAAISGNEAPHLYPLPGPPQTTGKAQCIVFVDKGANLHVKFTSVKVQGDVQRPVASGLVNPSPGVSLPSGNAYPAVPGL